MPLYEYRCEKCRTVSEILQKLNDPPATECEDEECGGTLVKLISSPAIKFKGSGFYINDYARGNSSKDSSSDGAESSSKTDSKKSTTSSSETATKTD